MVATAQHIIAQSSNGSLFAVQSSSNSSSSVIRCYDGSITNGSLKFTLRVPPSPSKKDASSSLIGATEHNNDAVNNDPIRKLVFASPPSSSTSSSSSSKYLCALREYTILIYDLDRGVVSHTLNVRDDHNSNGSSSSSRKSSIGGNEQNKAIVGDAALTDDDQLCVLVFFPSSEGGNSSGKCRIYQYDLAAGASGQGGENGATGLKRKIKVGSVSSTGTSNGDELLPSFGVAVSSSSSTSNNNKKGGSSSSSRVIVIRMNDGIRVCDYQSGEKIGKAHIPLLESTTASTDDDEGGGLSVISSVRLSECSRYVVTASKNHITIFNVLRKTDDNDEKKKKSSVKMVAQLSCNDNSKVSNVELVKTEEGGLNVLAFQPLAGVASLFTCDDLTSSSSFDSSSPPLLPKAQFQCDQGSSNHIALIHAAFHSRRPNEELLILFQNISSKGGSSSSNATLPMQSISYDNDATKGTVTVGTELAEEIANEGDNKRKKRKATDSVALASGEQGNEASLAMDLTSKKARKGKGKGDGEEGGSDDDGGDDFQIDDEDDEEGGEQGQSIAERLALLSSAMEESEDDEDEDEDGNEQGGNVTAETKKSKFKLKSATSETLTTLLTQALTSNDAVQLNIALQVTDRRLVEATVRSLQALDVERVQSSSAGYMSTLMGHIVRRMARRHSLVVPLGVWVKAILAATQRAATSRALQPNLGGDADDHIVKEAREIALKLGPLRNFLNERVECFPQLLRLDGRLALLSEQL